MYAQQQFGVQVNAEMAFALEEIGSTTLNTGFGYEVLLSYQFIEYFSMYAGWSNNHFSVYKPEGEPFSDLILSGYSAGLQFKNQLGTSEFGYMMGIGGIYSYLKVEDAAGNLVDDSGYGFGWQADFGISLTVKKHLLLMPYIRYRSIMNDLLIQNKTIAVHLPYFAQGLAVAWYF